MPKMTALGPVKHDGVDVAEGEDFDVKSKADAELLEAAGAAKPAAGKSKAQAKAEAEAEAKAAAEAADAKAREEAAANPTGAAQG